MKHLFISSLLCVLLSSCLTTKKTSESYSHEKETSLVVRDSVVIRDSVVVKYNTLYTDSVIIRDSVVVVLDHLGGIVSRERFKNVESYKDATKEKESSVRHDSDVKRDLQSDSVESVEREKVVKKKLSPLHNFLMLMIIITASIFVGVGLWKLIRK